VQPHQVQRAGAQMQIVDVLRDDPPSIVRAGPAREHVVRWVGRTGCHLLAPPGVPLPDRERIAREGLGRRQVCRAEVIPETASTPERGNAARCGDAGAGQDRDGVRGTQPRREFVEGIQQGTREGRCGAAPVR